MYKHILLPTDGSRITQNAIAEGIALAKSIGARVTGIHVTAPFHVFTANPLMMADTENEYDAETETISADVLSVIEKLAREKQVVFKGVHARGERPWEEIIKTADAEGCDLIMMASHGRTGVAGVLIGSETQKVLTHSKIPVLVTR